MILLIIQARLSSTRLPGKVLKSLLDKPMLQRQIERIHFAKNFDWLSDDKEVSSTNAKSVIVPS